MVPMIDTATIPGMTMTLMAFGPAVVGTLVALLGGLAWAVSGTNEELRRMAARDFERRAEPPADPQRLAA